MIRSIRVLLLLIPFIVAACGSAAPAQPEANVPTVPPQTTSVPTSEPTPTVVEATVEAAVTYPRTLTHSLGSISIPEKPLRVITLSSSDTDVTLALGITPLAIAADPYTSDGIAPWLKDKIDTTKTEILKFEAALPLEQIAALQPDLILAGGLYNIADEYEALSQIAPTTAWLKESFTDRWDEQALFAGQALGEDTRIQQLIDDTRATITAVKNEYPELAGKTFSVSIIRSSTSVGSINTQQDFAVQFFQDLGLTLTPKLSELATTQEGLQAEFSLEQLDMIDADLTVLSFVSPELQTTMESNPLYQQLAAVQNQTITTVDIATIAQMRGPTLLGIPWLLEQLRPAFSRIAQA